jgi:rare lipoprotein A
MTKSSLSKFTVAVLLLIGLLGVRYPEDLPEKKDKVGLSSAGGETAAASGVTGDTRAKGFPDEVGLASVYSGGLTANGERATPSGMTAAHRYLPFGTIVRVTNRNTGQSVVVRINDRGPFVSGRIIDLTPAAAHQLGFSGIVPVSLAVVGRS